MNSVDIPLIILFVLRILRYGNHDMYEIPILFYYFELQHCTAMGYTKDESSLVDKK